MREVLVYSGLRLGLFVAALGVVLLIGGRGLLAVLIAMVISLVVSFVALGRQREALAELLRRRRSSGSRFDAMIARDEAAEDAADDAHRARERGGEPS